MFEQLHLDVYQLIFAYLTQQDLLDMLLINKTFYWQIMKYIPKLKKTSRNFEVYEYCKLNLIISIKLSAKLYQNEWNYYAYWNHANFGLEGACESSNMKLIEFMIKKGATFWNWGLEGVCRGGHKMLVELMIEKGAWDWNRGLLGACEGGHKMLAEWMIEKGANDWILALQGACRGGHKKLVEMMINKGATRCYWCKKSMEEHLK